MKVRIVEDVKMDKSKLYGLNAVEGAWVVTMKYCIMTKFGKM